MAHRQSGGRPEPGPPGLRRRQRRRPWISRHPGWSAAIGTVTLIAVIGGIASTASSGKPAAKTAATVPASTVTAGPSKAASSAANSCRTQVQGWAASGGSSRIGALSSALRDFSTASQQFVEDNNAGGAAESDVPGVKLAAAELQGGAMNLGGDPAPRCAAALRSDLKAVAADYWRVGADAGTGMGQYDDSNRAAATADMDSALAEIEKGNAETAKASGALQKYED